MAKQLSIFTYIFSHANHTCDAARLIVDTNDTTFSSGFAYEKVLVQFGRYYSLSFGNLDLRPSCGFKP